MAKNERISEMKDLINLGKERGYLTYDELNHALPTEAVDSEEMDSILTYFGDMNIDIVGDESEQGEFGEIEGEEEEIYEELETLALESEEDAEEAQEAALSAAVRTDDPVRLYLKEMGSVPLLTRDGEIRIAQRIEEGKTEVFSFLFGIPLSIQSILGLRDRIQTGVTGIRDVIDVDEEEETEEGKSPALREATETFIAQASRIEEQFLKMNEISQEMKSVLKDQAKKRALRDRLRKIRHEVVEVILEMHLQQKQIDILVEKLRDVVGQFEEAERQLEHARRKIGHTRDEIQRRLGDGSEEPTFEPEKKELYEQYAQAHERIAHLEVETLLSPSEAKESLQQIFRGEEKVREAKAELIKANLRLVVSIAKRYTNRGLQFLDLIQEGNIGLMKAVKRFDPEQGVRLVSFAVHWIKAEMHEFILRNWRIVKVATTKAQRKLFFNLRSARQSSGWLGQEESAAIAEDLGVSQEAVLEMEGRMAGQDYSLQYESDDEEGHGRTLELEDPGESSVEALIDRDWDQQRQRGLRAALQSLSERDRYIIQNRWLSDDPKTLQALGEELGVSAERVRQLEKSGMEKLRSRLLEYVPA